MGTPTNIEIQTAERNIEKLVQRKMEPNALNALNNERKILRLAEQLLAKLLGQAQDVPAYELPGIKVQLQCRKEARVFYEDLIK